jgi:SET domain-containing protein
MTREARDKVEIGSDPRKGRGLFARAAIAAGTIIEAAPVVVLSPAECQAIDQTALGHYYFHWEGDFDGGTGALPLGYVALCNHAARPNAEVRRNYAAVTLELIAKRAIAAGQEITIDYGCPLWFEVAP